MNGKLNFLDFHDLFQAATGASLTQHDFIHLILLPFERDNHEESSSLTFNGLVNFITSITESQGEETLSLWLANLGYDKSLRCYTSRQFTLSFHSEKILSIEICDSLISDCDLEL